MRAKITFDEEALSANVALMRGVCGSAALHAVIKAGAYGLGAGFGGLDWLTDKLLSLGCSAFVFAEWESAVSVRARHPSVSCFALNGIVGREDAEGCLEHGILPVLNTLDSWHLWQEVSGKTSGGNAPYALHVDTGMNRLGLREEEAMVVAKKLREGGYNKKGAEVGENGGERGEKGDERGEKGGEGGERGEKGGKGGGMYPPMWLMSHLACGDDQVSPYNLEQLEKFKKICLLFPDSLKSFANSAGCFLGEEYHFDAVRVGASLYGLNPVRRFRDKGRDRWRLRNVVSIEAPIVQLRDVGVGEYVGYGCRWVARRDSRIAIVAFGYGDGYPFCSGGSGMYQEGILGGGCVRVVGRVSMDLLAMDVTDLGVKYGVGDYVVLLGGGISAERIAWGAGDLNYNVLGGMGSRGLGRGALG